MGLSLDGLASGMPTTDLIRATMDVERIPQQQLQAKVAASKDLTSIFQLINSKIADLTASATGYAKPGAMDLFTGTSSSPSVSVATAEGATAGELNFVVDKTATAHSAVTGAMTAWPESPATLTLTRATGDPIEITAASGSLDDVVKAVNQADAGVKATKVAAADGQYRIQFTSTETGTAAAFDITGSNGDSIFTAPGAAVIRQGQDAEITLFKGTDAEETISSATNTFSNVLAGVSVTVTAASADPVNVTVAKDADGVTKKANDLVNSLNDIFGYIKLKSAASTTTDASGKTKVTPGVLMSDSTVRTVKQNLMNAATYPVDGKSPSEMGIVITKDGLITFDADKFKAALAKDPAATEAALQEISSRVAAAGKTASDKYDGQITSKITSQETQVRNLNDQIANWDIRLAKRESSLKAIYSSMEVAMSKLNAQMASLASSISSMSNNKDSK